MKNHLRGTRNCALVMCSPFHLSANQWCFLRHSRNRSNRGGLHQYDVMNNCMFKNLVLSTRSQMRHGSLYSLSSSQRRITGRSMRGFSSLCLESCTNPDELYQYAKHVALSTYFNLLCYHQASFFSRSCKKVSYYNRISFPLDSLLKDAFQLQ